MRFDPDKCPECGQKPRGTADTIPGVAEFVENDDGSFDYCGNTDVFRDGQMTETDEDKRLRLLCPDGHDWYATMSE